MTFIPEKKSERIKIVALILGAVVFVVMGYFQFIHKKSSSAAAQTPSAAPLGQLQVPRVEPALPQKVRRAEPRVHASLPAVIRDIFAPFASLSPENGRSAQRQSTEALPAMELQGTIVGGGKPLAIIDDQFVGKGDWIGEYRVVLIGKNRVLLDSGFHQIKLEMVKDE